MPGKVGEKTTPALAAKLKALVERVESGVLSQKFNTAIAGLMEFVNTWREEGMVLSQPHLEMFAGLLSLFAPDITNSIRPTANGSYSWPDVSAIEGVDEVMVTIAVQVNGKLRATVEISKQESENRDKVVEMIMADERVKKWVAGEPNKVIWIPGKLVNIVIK